MIPNTLQCTVVTVAKFHFICSTKKSYLHKSTSQHFHKVWPHTFENRIDNSRNHHRIYVKLCNEVCTIFLDHFARQRFSVSAICIALVNTFCWHDQQLELWNEKQGKKVSVMRCSTVGFNKQRRTLEKWANIGHWSIDISWKCCRIFSSQILLLTDFHDGSTKHLALRRYNLGLAFNDSLTLAVL